MKNTGKPSENTFDEAWQLLGKHAFVYTPTDASKARGTNKKHVFIEAQPSDRVITYQGVTFYAEVKSSTDPRRFNFSLLRIKQSAFARQIILAGGIYDVFVHSLDLDRWYRVPYQHILVVKDGGKSSIPWNELENFKWTLPSIPT